jgi:chlorobactene glucosyltransferase
MRVLPGKELPAGWRGKPWACQQLSTRAKGEWLLFTDADTWHDPDMLKRSVQYARKNEADVVSLMNEQVTRTWMEKLIVPVMVFSLVSYFPGAWALKPRSPWSRFAGVGGQFILIRREVYRAVGGHESVKKEIVEDLSLGKELVQRGYKVVMGNGSDFTRCRMYGSAREVWEGFSKNMFPAAGYSLFRMGAVLVVLLGLGTVPFGLLLLGSSSSFFFPSLILALSQLGVRWAHARLYKMSSLSVLLHPVGSFIFALIGLNSVVWFLMGKGHWKGRSLQPLAG